MHDASLDMTTFVHVLRLAYLVQMRSIRRSSSLYSA